MGKFPVDAPKVRVMTALRRLGFEVVREGNHISIKASTLRTVLNLSLIHI